MSYPLIVERMEEHLGNAELVGKYPKMAKYIDWPMLLPFKVRS